MSQLPAEISDAAGVEPNKIMSSNAEGSGGKQEPDRGARLREQIVGELEKGRRTKAARLFAAGHMQGVCPQGRGLQGWLVDSIGKERTAGLIDGFARTPCFFCGRGLEPCELCHGRGHSEEGEICEPCLALGIARCDFCGGSGWAAIDAVPEGLRVPVVIRRAQMAIPELEKLLDRPAPRPTSEDISKVFKRCARLLLDLNRLVGVLENTVMAARDQQQHHSSLPGRKLVPVATKCIRVAARGEALIRELLECMAESARRRAKASGRNSRKRIIASGDAEFYSRLSRASTFAGTSLEHPFLREAVNHLRKGRTGTGN